MMRIPGPSQVSRARASWAVTARLDGLASGVRRRSLTTMTRRPRGTSTRVAPGSAENRGATALFLMPSRSARLDGWVVALTAPPS